MVPPNPKPKLEALNPNPKLEALIPNPKLETLNPNPKLENLNPNLKLDDDADDHCDSLCLFLPFNYLKSLNLFIGTPKP